MWIPQPNFAQNLLGQLVLATSQANGKQAAITKNRAGKNSTSTTLIKIDDAEFSFSHLRDNDGCNQVTTYHKENVNTNKTTTKPVKSSME